MSQFTGRASAEGQVTPPHGIQLGRQGAAQEREGPAYEQWVTTSPGRARLAYERGDAMFQCGLIIATQQGHVEAGVGVSGRASYQDANPNLNAIVAEGWELVSFSAVFVPTEAGSRDKFLSSGQQVAVSGETVGYYVFRRRPAAP